MSQIRVDTHLRERRAIKAKRLTLQIVGATTWIVLTSTMLVACQQRTTQSAVNEADIPQATRRTTEAKQTANPESIGTRLKEGMAYADLRKIVIDGGWKPVVDAECKSNVVGSGYESLCKSDPELSSCTICDRLPELSACSGDAYCGMHFSNGIQRLHVVTYGDFADWNVPGNQSQMSVSGLDFSKQ